MALLTFVTFVLLLGSAQAQNVATGEGRTLNGVITLLNNLKAEVQTQKANETAAYQHFACYCKSENTRLSNAILGDNNQDNLLSASVTDRAAETVTVQAQLGTRQNELNEQSKAYEENSARCQAARAEYEASRADLEKTVNSIKEAINNLADAQACSGPTALRLIQKNVAFAQAMGLVSESSTKKLDAFLQQDPSRGEYETRIPPPKEVLEGLLAELQAKVTDLDNERAKDKESCDILLLGISDQMNFNKQSIASIKSQIGGLESDAADNRGNLVTASDVTYDDKFYLRDLTHQCELRAKEYDQRSKLQTEEITAIDAAIAELAPVQTALMQNSKIKAPVSFLQSSVVHARVRNLRGQTLGSASADKAIVILRSAAQKLSSPVLASLAAKVAATPFDKVKSMINQLIGTLLDEAKEEAEKKAFCDKQLKAAEQDKEFKAADVEKFQADVQFLTAEESTLSDAITTLGEETTAAQQSLSEAEASRQVDADVAAAAVTEAQQTIVAVQKAIDVLAMFYNKAAGQGMLLQKQEPGESSLGVYNGKQAAATNVIGLLNNIIVDSKETIATTQKDEASAADAFKEFERTSKAAIAAKEKESQLKSQDLERAGDEKQKKSQDLATAQALVIDADETIAQLTPQCSNVHMQYTQRMAQIEEEKTALKKALCAFDEKGEHPECEGI